MLYKVVRADCEAGRLSALQAIIHDWRQRARRLDPPHLVGAERERAHRAGPVDPHRLAERRSLAIHRVVARRLRRTTAADALHLVWQWRQTGVIAPQYASRWEAILDGTLRQIRLVLTSDDPTARELRQNSPLAGVLSPAERQKILDTIR